MVGQIEQLIRQKELLDRGFRQNHVFYCSESAGKTLLEFGQILLLKFGHYGPTYGLETLFRPNRFVGKLYQIINQQKRRRFYAENANRRRFSQRRPQPLKAAEVGIFFYLQF